MKSLARRFLTPLALWAPLLLQAQVPVQPNPDHARLLASADPHLAANKRLVYDFWREVMEAGHAELAKDFLSESFIQHDPELPASRAAFAASFPAAASKAIGPRVKDDLMTITAEGDLVVLGFAAQGPDPKDAAKTYSTTMFDMFRVEGGKIVEHWNASLIDAECHVTRISQ